MIYIINFSHQPNICVTSACLDAKDQHLFENHVMNGERLNLKPLFLNHEILSLFWINKCKTDKW